MARKIIRQPDGKKSTADKKRKNENGPAAVEIVRYADPKPIVLVRCVLEDGVARLEGNPDPSIKHGSDNIIADLEVNGVPSLTDPEKKLCPKDGEKFLQALLVHFRTVYLGAREEQKNN